MGFTKETIEYELQHAAKLHNKSRGELAELAFMRKAATRGFSVAKPCGESERYDVIVRADRMFWRVQIKSVWCKAPQRHQYRVRTVNCRQVPYTPDEIDFLVAYIFQLDSWYVFPVSVVEGQQTLYITPRFKESRHERYCEAWNLMRPSCTEPVSPETAIETASKAAAGS